MLASFVLTPMTRLVVLFLTLCLASSAKGQTPCLEDSALLSVLPLSWSFQFPVACAHSGTTEASWNDSDGFSLANHEWSFDTCDITRNGSMISIHLASDGQNRVIGSFDI